MSFPAVTTPSPSNIESALFDAVYIRGSGEKWQTLGGVAIPSLSVIGLTAEDSYQDNRSIQTYEITAYARMRQTAFQELLLLESICNGSNDFLFRLSDAVAVTGVAATGWVYVSASQVGVKARFVVRGTQANERYIELQWQGSVYASPANQIALFTPTLAAGDFESSANAGTFHDIGTYTVATDGGENTDTHIVSSGFASVTLDLEGGSNPVTIGPITEAEATVEMLAVEDSLRRFLPNAVAFDIRYDWMASDSTDVLLLGDMLPLNIKAIFTLIDSVEIVLDGQVGIDNRYSLTTDFEGMRLVSFAHRGKINQSALNIDFPWDWSSTTVYFTNTNLKFSRGAP